MAKAIKQTVTPMWLEIKEMYKENTNGSDKYGSNFPINGELDKMCHEFIDLMGEHFHKEKEETWYAQNEDQYDYLDEEPTDLDSNKNINIFA